MYYFYWTSTTIRKLGEKAGSLHEHDAQINKKKLGNLKLALINNSK